MRPARRACGWEQGEWAGRRAARGAQAPCGVEAFGLIAAAPVKVGHSRQARRSRPTKTYVQPFRGRRKESAGEKDGGRLLWERLQQERFLLERFFWELDRIGGMIRQARRLAG